MDLAFARESFTGGASRPVVVFLVAALIPGQLTPIAHSQKMVVLHATVTITGGVTFTGTYDTRVVSPSCADLAKSGTNPPSGPNKASFYLPDPPNPNKALSGGPVGGGHNFSSDVAAYPYHGPGTYTGATLSATQLDADTLPNDQETHIFAFPVGIGTMIVKPDASGSFQFNGLQDAGSVRISGTVTWTCSYPGGFDVAAG
jgi:hypothetical protein